MFKKESISIFVGRGAAQGVDLGMCVFTSITVFVLYVDIRHLFYVFYSFMYYQFGRQGHAEAKSF